MVSLRIFPNMLLLRTVTSALAKGACGLRTACCGRVRASRQLCGRGFSTVFRSQVAPFTVSHKSAGMADPAPVALLLGWLGAKDRGLQKYAELYHSIGCETVLRYTAPATDVFLRRSALRETAERALNSLSTDYAGRPAVLVSFSNGGAFVHEQLADLLREDALRPASERKFSKARIAATVFDSAPAALTLAAGTRALTGSIKNPVLRQVAFALGYALMGAAIPLIWDANRPQAYFASLLRDPLRVPSLYIYSDADEITDATSLARFVQERRAILAAEGAAAPASAPGLAPVPVPVRELRIGAGVRSPHVSHFLAQPDVYREALQRFLLEDARMGAA